MGFYDEKATQNKSMVLLYGLRVAAKNRGREGAWGGKNDSGWR
jgi:hypothetical protein